MALLSDLWRRRGHTPAFVVLSLGTVLVLLGHPLVDAHLRGTGIATEFRYYDFGAYRGAVDAWLDGEPIYVEADDGGYHGSYLYPPVVLLLFYPFVEFSHETSAILWGAFSILLLWIGLQAVVSALGRSLGVVDRLLGLLLLVGFQPVLFDFKMGQISTFLAAMLCFAFYAFERGRSHDANVVARLASGAFTTLGSAVKLFYATSGAHLLRDRVRLLGAFGTLAALAVLSLSIFGVETHRAYLDVLLWGKGWGEESRSPTLWAPAYYRPFYVLGDWGMAVRIVGVLGVIALTLAARSADVGRETFALGVAAIPLFAPRAYTQDFVVLLLPAVVLLALELRRARGRPWIPVLAVLLLHWHAYGLYVLVTLPEWVPLAETIVEHAGWLQPGLWGTLLLVGLAAVRVGQGVTVPDRLRPARLADRARSPSDSGT